MQININAILSIEVFRFQSYEDPRNGAHFFLSTSFSFVPKLRSRNRARNNEENLFFSSLINLGLYNKHNYMNKLNRIHLFLSSQCNKLILIRNI